MLFGEHPADQEKCFTNQNVQTWAARVVARWLKNGRFCRRRVVIELSALSQTLSTGSCTATVENFAPQKSHATGGGMAFLACGRKPRLASN
jgi:hypothetical protein